LASSSYPAFIPSVQMRIHKTENINICHNILPHTHIYTCEHINRHMPKHRHLQKKRANQYCKKTLPALMARSRRVSFPRNTCLFSMPVRDWIHSPAYTHNSHKTHRSTGTHTHRHTRPKQTHLDRKLRNINIARLTLHLL